MQPHVAIELSSPPVGSPRADASPRAAASDHGRAVAPSLRTAARWAGITLLFAGIVISRRPDALLHPQFYAEDGQAWYADAHNLSAVHALFLPIAGYYQFFQRFVAFVFSPLSLTATPLAFAIVALTLQTIPALVVASPRLRGVIADDRARVLIGGVYLLIPNLELSGNLTNTQWHLAVLAFVLLLASPPRSLVGRALEIPALIFAGLSGPYALFLVPLGLLMHRKDLGVAWRRIQLSVLAATGVIEVGVMLAASTPRTHGTLGVSVVDLPLILANEFLSHVSSWGFSRPAAGTAALVATLIALVLFAGFRRGPRPLRFFIVFALAVMATGMVSPYGRLLENRPAWDLMATGGLDNRYFFMYSVAVVLSGIALLCGLRRPQRWIALSAAALLVFAVPAVLGEWQYIAIPSENLQHYAAVLRDAPRGTVVSIPIYPKRWSMQLIAPG